MSTSRSHPSGQGRPLRRPKDVGRRWGWVAAAALVVVLVVVVVAPWKRGASESSLPAGGATSTAGLGEGASTNGDRSAGSAATTEAGGVARVLGRWIRPDGGYLLELRAVDGVGRLEAAYLNPNPIHVARAEAREEDGKLTVFVELQDVNYPGSTYRLTYFPQTDQLYGTYYQAALGQTYDVDFQRVP